MEFNGVVSSNVLKGKARVVIDVDAVTIETVDRALSLSYADVIDLKAMDYAVALLQATKPILYRAWAMNRRLLSAGPGSLQRQGTRVAFREWYHR
jgi:hypothetical protein